MTELNHNTIQQIRQSLGNIPGAVQYALLGPGANAVAMENQRLAMEAQRDTVKQAGMQNIIQTMIGLSREKMAMDRQDERFEKSLAANKEMQGLGFDHDLEMLRLKIAAQGGRRGGGGGRGRSTGEDPMANLSPSRQAEILRDVIYDPAATPEEKQKAREMYEYVVAGRPADPPGQMAPIDPGGRPPPPKPEPSAVISSPIAGDRIYPIYNQPQKKAPQIRGGLSGAARNWYGG